MRFKLAGLSSIIGAFMFGGPISGAWAQGFDGPASDWMQRVHIGGDAAVRTMVGQSRAQLERDGGIMVYQAGLIFDIDITNKLSFWYDADLIREGIAHNPTDYPLQEIYVRWDGVLNQDWLNAKIGRTFVPFGEEYKRWHAIDNPLASWSTSLTWGIDEGILLFGDILPNSKLSYATAVQNGNERFNFSGGPHRMVSGRLSSKPVAWFSSSLSYINIGPQDGTVDGGGPEFWLSGPHLSAVNPGTGPGTSNVIGAQGVEGDVFITPGDLGQIWLRYGYIHTMDGAGADFNRNIRYYSSEIQGNIPKTEGKLYLVGRYSIIGTMSPTLGYQFAGTEAVDTGAGPGFALLDSPYAGLTPFSQRDLYRYSLGLGYRIQSNTLVKAEYSWEDTHLIESAKTPENMALLGQRNFFVLELDVKF